MTAPIAPEPADAGTTEDTLLGGSLRIRQPTHGYRVAVDPILLAAAVPARSGDSVLEAGTGIGAAALCLAHRVPGCRIVGIEIQQTLAVIAEENAAANGFAESIRILEGDITAPPTELRPAAFDHVMTNPPYLRASESRISPSSAKAVATVELDFDLAAWLGFCVGMAKPRGTVTVVHRADRLDDVVAILSESCGALVVFPLWPKAGEDAKRMIVRGMVGRETPLRLSAGLALHDDTGGFTPEAEAVLRDGAALPL